MSPARCFVTAGTFGLTSAPACGFTEPTGKNVFGHQGEASESRARVGQPVANYDRSVGPRTGSREGGAKSMTEMVFDCDTHPSVRMEGFFLYIYL